MNIHPHFWPIVLLLSLVFSVHLAQTTSPSTPESDISFAAAPSSFWEFKKAESEPISILLAGDIMLGRYIGTLRSRALIDADPANDEFPFTYMPELLAVAMEKLGTDHLDLVAANLEGPIVENQVAWGDLVFRFDPEVASLLKKMGFTLFQLSNNHTYNQTRAGFTETQRHLETAGLDYFGVPDTALDPTSFIRYDFGSSSVGFLGLNDTDFKLDLPTTLAKIQELSPTVDFLIIGIHWGIEYKTTASSHQQELAHAFIDAGADFVWGTHPHVVENSEVYSGKTIYYSLGNFVFDQYWSAATQKGLVLALRLDPITSVNAEPALTTVELPVQLLNKGEPSP